MPNLPADIQTLQDCCTENLGVTSPIRSGVGPTSPLSGLTNLLKYLYAFGILATLLDVLLALLDMPDVILGEMMDINLAARVAESAANAALGIIDNNPPVAVSSYP